MGTKVVALLHCNADAEEAFEMELKKLVETSLLDEGCIKYELYQYQHETCHYIIIEEWQSEQALAKHREAPHYKHFGRVAPVLLAAQPQIKVLERLV